jgi:holin-like protein
LKTLVLVLLFHSLGQICAAMLDLPVPGTVIGLIGLLAWLLLATPQEAADAHEKRAAPFLKHLGLLFIPGAVGILVHLQRLADEAWALAATIAVSAVLCILGTALALRAMTRKVAADVTGDVIQ